MSKGLNNCQFIGNLGNDPQIKYTQSGTAVANLSLGVTETWVKDGNRQERTEWVRVSAFGKLAEIIGEYLKKGSKAYISGKMQTRKWQDQGGQDRYTTEIIADQMIMLDSRSSGNYEQHRSAAPPAQPAQEEFEDDIPF